MRLRYLLLVFAGLSAASSRAQAPDWQLLSASPPSGRWEDGSFIDPQTGWIVEGGGRVFRTVDAGLSWQLVSDVPGYLRTAAFTSATQGWVGVLFHETRLYETQDGGATMTDVTARIAPAVSGGICGLWSIDGTTVVGVGQWSGPAYAIRTTDGGATWQSHSLSALAGSLIDVVFLDSQRGFAVGGTAGAVFGGRAVVLATEDGGATWTHRFTGPPAPAGTGEWAWKISFPTPLVGYVSIERTSPAPDNGRVLKTTDGGLTWTVLDVPGVGSMQGAGFLTAQRGWVSGRGVAAETNDGGLTWTPTSSIDGSVNRFEFFGDSLGYAMGQHVFFLDARTSTPTESPAPDGAVMLAVRPNPSTGPVAIDFGVERDGDAVVSVYDALGRRVVVLADGPHAAGMHAISWSGTAADGRALPAGLYVVRLESADGVSTRSVALVP